MRDRIYTNTEVSDYLAERLRAMPKIELHVHLEGATDAETVWAMAKKNNVSLPATSLDEWKAMYAFRDFNHFVEIYIQAAECMKTPEDFTFMTERFLKHQSSQNVRYCEVFLSASLLIQKFPFDEIIDALQEGAERGEKETGVQIRFIPDIARHVPETSQGVLDFVLAGQKKGLFLGLGLGGPEVGFPPELFTEVYEEARKSGLRVVAHAGETVGPESVWGAIHALKSERIGHGVRSVEDPELMDYLAEVQIPLEVNPVSNYRLKVVPLDQPHPIRELVDHGVFVTVNSDDPPMFSTDLNREYLLLAQQGFTWEELWQLNKNAIEASFLGEEEKQAYRSEWNQSY
ncbi:MAG: adenosine deaminase [Rhodothermaceae bacterium]|nr:adenosine deaminase [Rhodothermaceae bacterium]